MNCKPDPYLKLPVKSDAPGLSKTWVKKLAPRLWKKKIRLVTQILLLVLYNNLQISINLHILLNKA